MKKKEGDYKELFSELSEYERSGIKMEIEDVSASPLQIVSAHMAREDCTYMRDYVLDEKGMVKEVNFYKVDPEE